MSKSNKATKKELERICGKGCFFKRAHCAKRIEEMGGIKTFKVFVKERKFKGKKISSRMTFHHLRHRVEGGETSVENGAIIEEIAHQYMHSLPREQEEVINDMIREFKMGFGILSGKGKMTYTGMVELNFDLGNQETVTIPVYDISPEEYDELFKKSDKQKRMEKANRLKNPSRAMKKRELQKIIEEEIGDRL